MDVTRAQRPRCRTSTGRKSCLVGCPVCLRRRSGPPWHGAQSGQEGLGPSVVTPHPPRSSRYRLAPPSCSTIHGRLPRACAANSGPHYGFLLGAGLPRCSDHGDGGAPLPHVSQRGACGGLALSPLGCRGRPRERGTPLHCGGAAGGRRPYLEARWFGGAAGALDHPAAVVAPLRLDAAVPPSSGAAWPCHHAGRHRGRRRGECQAAHSAGLHADHLRRAQHDGGSQQLVQGTGGAHASARRVPDKMGRARQRAVLSGDDNGGQPEPSPCPPPVLFVSSSPPVMERTFALLCLVILGS